MISVTAIRAPGRSGGGSDAVFQPRVLHINRKQRHTQVASLDDEEVFRSHPRIVREESAKVLRWMVGLQPRGLVGGQRERPPCAFAIPKEPMPFRICQALSMVFGGKPRATVLLGTRPR